MEENKAQALLESVKNYYLKRGRRERESAVFLLSDIIARYPRTDAAREAGEILPRLKGK